MKSSTSSRATMTPRMRYSKSSIFSESSGSTDIEEEKVVAFFGSGVGKQWNGSTKRFSSKEHKMNPFSMV